MLKLGLLENSHAFLREAAAKAAMALNDDSQWQFAILNVAQSLELSLKALLRIVHPLFVYKNVDSPKDTVGPIQAMLRLKSMEVNGLSVTESEELRIRKIVGLRNTMTHSEFELSPSAAAAKFFETFAFVVDFQSRHLGTELNDLVAESDLQKIMVAKKAVEELAARAEARIDSKGIPAEWVWDCPDCGYYTFVAHESEDTCYTCRYSGEVLECNYCHNHFHGDLLESFELDLDWSCGEGGRAELENDFGYVKWKACSECLSKILADISKQRRGEEERVYDEEWNRKFFNS